MRKPIVAAGVAAVGLFGVSALAPAFASDLRTKAPVYKAPVYKAPVAAPAYNWSGFYAGFNFGSGWSNGSLNVPGNNLYGGLTEFIGGAQAGYNYQAGHLVLGVEGDFDGAAFGHPVLPSPTTGVVSHNWVSTVAGRVGLAEDRWLMFAKFGGGWAQSSAALNLPGSVWTGSSTNSGWLVGVGVEYGFKPHWTVKMEYDYLQLSSWNSPTVPPVALSRDLQMVKFGMNYKFESGGSVGPEPVPAGHSARSDEDLQKQSQNPIADLVSLPFQSNTNFNSGPFNRTQEVLNIQPVVPMHLNEDWNVISRTIVPLISQPSPLADNNVNGVGDITEQLYFSPTHPGPLIWGVGPVFTVPSGSNPFLGTGKVLAGPGIVMLVTPGHWVIGAVANNQWSVGGNPLAPAVNTFLVQPFVNYNMAEGWYLTSAPVITSNWLAASGQQWTVPVGGGFGRVFRVGEQPVNASIAGYYNAIRPTGTGSWQLRFQLALLFPVK